MKDKKKTDRCSKVTRFVVGSALTIIDFDDKGPDTVPYSENTKEEE